MNNTRRKRIEQLVVNLEDNKADLETILEEEQESYDNMPESFQDGERGQISQDAISTLESAQSSLESVIDELGSID